ncbi:MAG: lipase [Deltaproteobacteria bacterium]|nr:lipase [Deltaproteobacteria bacterium]
MSIVWCILVFEGTALGLSCGTFRYPKCGGPEFQFAGGFNPQTGFGGFGGGACRASRTPVIFVHGNGDRAINWDSPANHNGTPARSVYQEFKARGYNDCELFGITYLSPGEQKSPAANYHKPHKYDIIIRFIEAVKIYTGKKEVDIVAHSLGVSMTLAALTYEDNLHRGGKGWAGVRRFVNIAGGIRGLPSCLATGFSNPYFATCGSQNLFNKYIFGFYPDSRSAVGFNRWTGAEGPLSLRRAPAYYPETIFYTLHAGYHDQIHCTTARGYRTCNEGALFEKSENVRAQLNIGAGQKTRKTNFNFDEWRPSSLSGGDADGVGHFKARNNAGPMIYEMLNTDCSGIRCKGSYTGGPVTQ